MKKCLNERYATAIEYRDRRIEALIAIHEEKISFKDVMPGFQDQNINAMVTPNRDTVHSLEVVFSFG